jgi:hypothetical protein
LTYLGNSNVENWSTPGVEYFSGDGVTTSFQLTRRTYTFADLVVVVENVIQHPDESYSWDHTTNSIVFFEAPSPGSSNIYVKYNSRQTSIIAPGQGTVTSDSLSVGAPSWTTTGNVTVFGTLTVEDVTTVESLVSNTSITAETISVTNLTGNGYSITGINADNIDYGTVDVARLGTGTTDDSTFLRGDGSWQPVVQDFTAGATGFFTTSPSTGTIRLEGDLNTANGGTGLTSFNIGGALYATSTSALTTGTLPVASGGTGSTTLAANTVIIGNGTNAVNTVAPGTANNILVSNGTNWVSAPATDYGVGVTGGGGRGTLYTTNGTFTVPLGVSQVKVTVIGAGGGFIVSPNLQFGANGGDGGVSVKFVTGLTYNQTIAVTVGTKGASANVYVGSASTGGSSSFGAYATATGGGGAYYDAYGVALDGNPGVATTGDLNMTGQKLGAVGSSYYYGQGDRRNQTLPNGLVLVEY